MRLTDMLAALLARFRPSKETRREATALVAMHGPQGAWIVASDKRRLAQVVDAQDDARRWNAVMREVERQTGYLHQPDTAKRMAERHYARGREGSGRPKAHGSHIGVRRIRDDEGGRDFVGMRTRRRCPR